jgi:spermidine/putrescine transport system permease protein
MKAPRLLWGLLPAIGFHAVFFLLPMAAMLLLSFWSTRNFEVVPEWTVRNYAALFTDAINVKIFGRTLWMSALITAAVVAFGYPFAWFLARYTQRWQQLLVVIVVIPFWTSSVLRAYAWMAILGSLLYNKVAVIIVGVYFLAPFVVLILYTSLEKMNWSLITAAADLGASPFRTFLHIAIPQTLPGIAAAAFFSFVSSLGFFVVPALVGGPDSVMMANLVGNLFHGGQLSMGAALSLVIAVIVLGLLVAAWRYGDFERQYGS